jgi:hypothetical protein
MDCLDNLTVYNVLAGHIGRPHHHPCGLPQGCPFSMMVLSLILRPWILKCRELQVKPRALADDILTFAGGHDHLNRTIRATNFTFEYLLHIGAKGAPNKSIAFSSCPIARKWLANQVWSCLGATIPVKTHMRDLGAHLSTGCRLHSTTLARRLRQAKPIAVRVGRLPASEVQKDNAIIGKVNGLALYGSETQPIPEAALSELQTAIVNAVGPRSTRRSPAVVFAIAAARGRELDPNVIQVVRKVRLFRRAWFKHPQDIHMFRDTLQHYTSLGLPGTLQDSTDLALLAPAPPPGAKGRHSWPKQQACQGPLGLLIRELYLIGAVIDINFVIHMYHEVSIDIIRCPWQHLGRAVSDMCARARTLAAPERNTFQGLREIDLPVLQYVRSHIPLEDIKIFDFMATGSAWDQKSKVAAGQTSDDTCPHCHVALQDFAHTLHSCPGLSHVRDKHVVWNSAIDYRSLPHALLVGLPPAMCVDPMCTFWGQQPSQLGLPDGRAAAEIGILGCRNFPAKVGHIPSSAWVTVEAMSNNHFCTNNMHSIEDCFIFDNARQLVANLRGADFAPIDMPHVDWCIDVAPDSINVYTDGGLAHPSKPRWQLGGVWHLVS